MNAVKLDTTVDEALAEAAPELRPLLGKRVLLIAVEAAEDPPQQPGERLSLDDLIAHRIVPPAGTPPLTDEAIERAIAAGAIDGNA